jgi:gluconokinase
MPETNIVIVMGVSGSGKSHLANQLARATGWAYAEGDDYHSTANKAKMHAGIPLTDEDRAPWLDALHQILLGWQRSAHSGILTCSALKKNYREHLAAGIPELRFVWLDPPKSVLAERLGHRIGHYMSPNLLDSQLATLEPPALDGKTLHLDGSGGIDDEVAKVLAFLKA